MATEHLTSGRLMHAAMRGVIAAMSMSGLRMLASRVGLLDTTPPEMIMEKRAPAFLRRAPEHRREAVIVLLHWTYGAAGGVVFGSLPDRLRLKPWTGPVFGLTLWLGFETVLSPLLGLRQEQSAKQRAVLAVDHLLYGLVLSEMRRRPQR
jgi:uncharacterized membrane protein YagU involved in acid resistance